jgi:hypothetical protein
MVQTGVGKKKKKKDAISKIIRAHRAGGVAQAADHLPSKYWVPNSNLNTTKNKSLLYIAQ